MASPISSNVQTNFGKIVLTDKLINIISKPDKFFLLLAENLIEFWNSEKERMFITILLSPSVSETITNIYSLVTYIEDFSKLCEFILNEMIKHKFIQKLDSTLLSREFVSPLFMFNLEFLLSQKSISDQKSELKKHVEFFWRAIKK